MTTLPPDGVTVGFPSADFPGPIPFRLRIPSAWRGFEVAEASLAVGSEEVVGRVRPSVVVRTHRITRSADPEIDLATLVAGDDLLPGVEVRADEYRAGPPAARWRHLRHDGPENVSVVTIRLLVLVPFGARLAEVISAVGTVAAGAPHEVRQEVEDVVESLLVAVDAP